jgi:hypothetical protein
MTIYSAYNGFNKSTIPTTNINKRYEVKDEELIRPSLIRECVY